MTGAALSRYDNRLRRGLAGGEFVVSVELVTPEAAEPFEGAIAPAVELAERVKADPRVHAIALTDRVKSDDDHDPVRAAARVAEACRRTPVVHLAGKDRDPAAFAGALTRMQTAALDNVLVVTGDRVRREPAGRPVRYHDSVNMVAQARAAGAFHILAAVSPFKYRDEELMGQYLKMAKKELAGADGFVTQIGWDMLKLKELMAYRRRHGLTAPVMAGVMLLTVARARYVRANRLAGIVVTDELAARLAEEARQPDRGLGAAYRRLALQIVGLKRLGYAGVHLSGMHHYEKLDRLLRQVEALDCGLGDEGAWWDAWWHALRGPGGAPTATAPRACYLFEELGQPGGFGTPLDHLTPRPLEVPPVESAEVRTFRRLDRLDRWVFRDGSPGAAALGPIARLVPAGSAADRTLHWVERQVKEPLVGCQTCGYCRLPATQYVCPETCPKGLANGPCGGTTDNTCEFGDRECVHNRMYRIARAVGTLDERQTHLVPVVPEPARDTCSWTRHFRGEDPPVVRLAPAAGPSAPRTS